MAHVAENKKKTVKEFAKLLDEYPIIGAVNVENLPAKQFQNMREKLRDGVIIRMCKRRLLNLAIDASKKDNIKDLKAHLKGMPALLFTKENPFSLFKKIKQNKSKAPIKAGQTAPNDLVVPAGPTPFAPGPIIGELGAFKIKTGVENGKVAVKADCIVAKEGDEVSPALASVLTRLGIEPMEIGLNVTAIYENGNILTKDVLDIDETAYLNNLKACAGEAFNLAISIGYPCEETIVMLLTKAHSDARALAMDQNILTDETVKEVLAKAEMQAKSLNSKLDLKTPQKESKQEAKATEEKKEEAPAEEKAENTASETTEVQEAPEEKKE